MNYSQAHQLRSFCSKRERGGSKSKNAGREFHLISIAKIRNFGGWLSVSLRSCPYKSVYVCFCLFAVAGRCHTTRLCISLPLAAELVAGSYAEHDELVFMEWQPPLECSHIYACRFSKLCHGHWFHNSINFWSWYFFGGSYVGELCWGVITSPLNSPS